MGAHRVKVTFVCGYCKTKRTVTRTDTRGRKPVYCKQQCRRLAMEQRRRDKAFAEGRKAGALERDATHAERLERLRDVTTSVKWFQSALKRAEHTPKRAMNEARAGQRLIEEDLLPLLLDYQRLLIDAARPGPIKPRKKRAAARRT